MGGKVTFISIATQLYSEYTHVYIHGQDTRVMRERERELVEEGEEKAKGGKMKETGSNLQTLESWCRNSRASTTPQVFFYGGEE